MATDNQAPKISDSLVITSARPLSQGGPARVLLNNFFAAVNDDGEDAEGAYQRALADLRERPESVLFEISQLIGQSGELDYSTRWMLVYTATQLRHPASLPLLVNLVQTPIPPERSKDPHSLTTVGQETILRTTAVEGIGYLATEGNTQALEVLVSFVQHPSFSIRRAAVQSVLATKPNREIRNQVKSMLPPDQQFLLELKQPTVNEVLQIKDPTAHLSEQARNSPAVPPPSFPGQEPKSGSAPQQEPKPSSAPRPKTRRARR
jgi:hypothetical protein